MRRVLYGGSFDPVHRGHLEIAVAAGRILGADRVHLVPAAAAPHKPGGTAAGADHRLAMVRLAAQEVPGLEVVDDEIRRGGVSYTVDTVERLLAGPFAGDELVLLLGQDALADLPNWRRVRDLAGLVDLAYAPRPGGPEPDWEILARTLGREAANRLASQRLATPLIDVSSTLVRHRLARGEPVADLLPPAVEAYIRANGLYGAAPHSGGRR